MPKIAKSDQVAIKSFSRLEQIMEFFPARNLRASYLFLKPKENLGVHKTTGQREVLGVLQGIAWAVVDNEVYKLKKDEMIYIPKGKVCNVYNRNKLNLKLIYIISKL
ncbi:MAG: cupin domain-containing protein [Patescibacteria group bacterium]|jgi:mannose-6-phosphate isomerase-like protein (cupin superfamily)